MTHENRQTPWGFSDYSKEYGPGIIFYGTPRHGGFWLSESRLMEMPEEIRNVKLHHDFTKWFEEDCDWSLVALAFPEYFEPGSCEAAIRIAKRLSDPENFLFPGWKPWNIDVSAYLANNKKGRECAAKAWNAGL